MPRLSLGLGVSSSSKLPQGRAAPSGIPVASTASVVIAGQNVIFPNGTYTKVTANGTRVAGSAVSDKLLLDTGLVYLKEAGYGDVGRPVAPYGDILIPPNTTFTATNFDTLVPESYWRAGRVYGLQGEESSYFGFSFANTNLSTDPTTIPTFGWSPSITITAPTFPDTATTNVVNALINTSNATITSHLQSVGFTAVGGVFSVPLTKQVPPSENFYSVEYKTTFNDGATCDLIHSRAANNRWFFFMEKFAYTSEEYGDQYATLIGISTTTGRSSATIPAARSSWSGTNANSMVSPNCFS